MLEKGLLLLLLLKRIRSKITKKMEVNLLFTVLVLVLWERAGGREAGSRTLYHIKSKQVG